MLEGGVVEFGGVIGRFMLGVAYITVLGAGVIDKGVGVAEMLEGFACCRGPYSCCWEASGRSNSSIDTRNASIEGAVSVVWETELVGDGRFKPGGAPGTKKVGVCAGCSPRIESSIEGRFSCSPVRLLACLNCEADPMDGAREAVRFSDSALLNGEPDNCLAILARAREEELSDENAGEEEAEACGEGEDEVDGDEDDTIEDEDASGTVVN